MSAGLSLIQNLAPVQPTSEPLSSVPSSAGERMDAAWQAAQTEDRYWNITAARRDRAARIIDDYHAVTGERLRNPFDESPTVEEIKDNPGLPTVGIYAKRLEVLRQKAGDLRNTMPDVGELPADYLNPDSIDSQIGQASRAARDREDNLMNTGNGLPAFVASAGGEMASPHGVLSAFLPVSRMPLAAAERTIAGFARNVGREALFQAGINVAAQIPASVIDYNTRKATGTEQTHEQLVEEFTGAAVGGALLGGLFRGAHLTVRRLQGKGIELTPEVRDAALVVESRDLYGDKNALGVPAAAHEAAVDRAVADVSRGRAADVADLIAFHGSPHTFDQFSLSKVGTGEGNAAYGHGIYLAEHPDVARRYADDVSRRHAKVDMDPNSPEFGLTGPADPKLYEARIAAKEGDFLDWEKPLSEQPEILAKLREAFGAVPDVGVKTSAQRLDDLVAHGGKGEDAYMWLSTMKGSDQAAASQALSDVGIPGHRYLDAGSRDAGGGTRNIVLYDTSKATITSRNGEELNRLQKMVEEPSAATQPFNAPEEPAAGRPTAESPQTKSMDAQVKQLLDEGGGASPEHRRAYEAALQQEKEARIATGCVGGGAI